MLVDTHAHLNFKVFKNRVDEVLSRAQLAGVEGCLVVGAHLKNSKLAVKLAQTHDGVWASVGIHPHHVLEYLLKAQTQVKMTGESLPELLDLVLDQVGDEFEELVTQAKVVAIGEAGLDLFEYQQIKYADKVDQELYLVWQKAFLRRQLVVAAAHNKAVILHNRQSIDDLLKFFADHPELIFPQKMVLHCCEPDWRLLQFAKDHQLFIGVDGDVTYDQVKQDFIKQVPLEMLVLETDCPFMTPEPDRSMFKQKKDQLKYSERVCEPRHIAAVAEFIAKLKNIAASEVVRATTANATQLFSLPT